MEDGVAGYVLGLAADQAGRGWDVSVACPADGGLSTELGATGISWSSWPARREPGLNVADETYRLQRLLAHQLPDLVHLHSAKAGLAGRLAVRGQTPTLFQPHGWSWWAARQPQRLLAVSWERSAGRWADRVICVSQAERDAGMAAGVRAAYDVVRNGVDVHAFPLADHSARSLARTRLGMPPPPAPVAVCVGRLCQQKGQDVLVRAWPLVRAAVPEAQLMLVGADNHPVAVGDGVVRVGARTDIWRWYAAADVVVFPSRWEGMSLALLEALATGRSVVATSVAGAREVGLTPDAIVPADDPGALAAAIVPRLRERSLRESEGRAARRFAEEHLQVRAGRDQLADIVHEVLHERAGSRALVTAGQALSSERLSATGATGAT